MAMPVTDRRAHKAAGEGGVPQFSFWLFIEALQDAEMAPAALAEEMEASHEAVARWMAGIAVPKPGYLKQAARILGKKPSDFYE